MKTKLIYGEQVIGYEDFLQGNNAHLGWRIAIPSYKRSNTIGSKTLAMLEKHGVPASKIDIFVANEEERIVYSKAINRNRYANLIVGVVGMMNIRNFIQSYYPEGQLLICMDDDLKAVFKIDSQGKKCPVDNLQGLFDYAFSLCKEVGTDYFGIYAASNTFFMDRTISVGLRYLIGSFWGMRVTHDRFTYVTMHDKEDFERSVRAYLKCGNVVRLDFISAESNYYGEKGGMQEERTEERVTTSGLMLMKMFPQQVVQNTTRKKHFEVKLVEKRERFKHKSKRKFKFM